MDTIKNARKALILNCVMSKTSMADAKEYDE